MVIVTDASLEIDENINMLIGDLTAVMDNHAKNYINGIPMRDGFYILMTALAERAAAVIQMANGVLESDDKELVGVFTDTITSILETARGVNNDA